MSFGLLQSDDAIRRAIVAADAKGVIFFASAANCGGNGMRSFPASISRVISIHATDGLGNKGQMNPTQLDKCPNYSTLGVAIPSSWKGEDKSLSGTSFATPIAAGFAANILAVVDHLVWHGKLNESDRNVACSQEGMSKIFSSMAQERDDYDYVTPWWKWWPTGKKADENDICLKIREALK